MSYTKQLGNRHIEILLASFDFADITKVILMVWIQSCKSLAHVGGSKCRRSAAEIKFYNLVLQNFRSRN